ncbi:MAG: porin [Aquificaceae bacterium]|nr:porin [Aquificaceae bacterium]MDW8236800.1 outer membrane beta-barrel protein [Aquificaceae bacterium]
MRAIISSLALFALAFSQSPNLKFEGAFSSYILSGDNFSRKTRYDAASVILSISKSPEPIGFTLTGGAYALPVVGLELSSTAKTTKLFSPIVLAYLEYAPSKSVSFQVGRLPTLIGYETPFSYQNPTIQRGLVWNSQPVLHHGARFIYSSEGFDLKLGINDGFYTLSKDASLALELGLSLKPSKDAFITFNTLLPQSDAKPNDTSAPSNKRQVNLLAGFSHSNISAGLDIVFIEAPKSDKAQVPKRAFATAGAIHLTYLKDPFKLHVRLEQLKDNSDEGHTDLIGIGDGNSGQSLSISPSYRKGNIFIKTELSLVRAKEPFTHNNKKTATRAGLEVGFLF